MINQYYSFNSDGFFMFTTHKQNLSAEKKTLKNISSLYGIDLSNRAKIKQVHSNNILFVKKPGEYGEFDGILTNNHQLIPQISTADCIPLFIYDTVENLYGVIHCGWRGIVSKIHTNAVALFLSKECKAKNIKIFTGPSIKTCCYEIGEEMIHKFDTNCINIKNNSYYLDLSFQLSIDLISNGIKKSNITHSNVCTFHNKNCHSFRRDGENSGRMHSMIIKE